MASQAASACASVKVPLVALAPPDDGLEQTRLGSTKTYCRDDEYVCGGGSGGGEGGSGGLGGGELKAGLGGGGLGGGFGFGGEGLGGEGLGGGGLSASGGGDGGGEEAGMTPNHWIACCIYAPPTLLPSSVQYPNEVPCGQSAGVFGETYKLHLVGSGQPYLF